MYSQNHALPKAWSDRCLKSAFSQYPSRSIMVNAKKHFLNLNGGTFMIFINHSEINSL